MRVSSINACGALNADAGSRLFVSLSAGDSQYQAMSGQQYGSRRRRRECGKIVVELAGVSFTLVAVVTDVNIETSNSSARAIAIAKHLMIDSGHLPVSLVFASLHQFFFLLFSLASRVD